MDFGVALRTVSSLARFLHVTKFKWSFYDKLGGTADTTSFVPLRENVWTHDVFLFALKAEKRPAVCRHLFY